MRKRLILTLCSLIMICLAFAGCALKGGPAASETVLGNGGLAVQKGEWLFFASGYESYANLETGNKNKTGSVEVGALYRAKLNTDGTVDTDDDGYPTNFQRVVSKLVGFEFGGIYIFGDQVFFSSPNTAKDKVGDYHFDQITFFKCNINGTGLSEIYSTSNYSSSGKFVFNFIENNVVLTVLDGTDLVKVSANGTATVLAEDITAAQMISQKDFATESVVPALKDFVFATRARTVAEGSENGVTGNILEKISVSTGTRTILLSNANTTYELKGITYSRVFYSKTNTLDSDGYIFSSGFNAQNSEVQHTVVSELTNFVPFEDNANGSYSGFVFTKNSKMYYQTFNDQYNFVEILSTTQTVLNCNNGNVYYKNSDSGISVVSVSSLDTKVLVVNSESSLKLDSSLNVDFASNFMFFMNKPTGASNYYLNRIYLTNGDDISAQIMVKPMDSDITED